MRDDAARVHRIPAPNVRDDGQRPSPGTGWRPYAGDLPRKGRGMFLREGLDGAKQVEAVEEIQFFEQPKYRPRRED
jgi:hypothetical protein